MSLRASIQAFALEYPRAREGTYGRASPVWSVAEQTGRAVLAAVPAELAGRLILRWSMGRGGWARIPWFALLCDSVTRSTRSGYYVAYLFCEDMSSVYLTLVLGMSKRLFELGRSDGLRDADAETAWLRERCASLAAHGFSADPPMDLHSESPAASDYPRGSIVHRQYMLNALPTDADLRSDLHALVVAYAALSRDSRTRQQ